MAKAYTRKPAQLLVLELKPDDKATFMHIDHTLEGIQKAVDGYFEIIRLAPRLASRSLVALVNDEGQIHNLAPNPYSADILRDAFGMRLVVGSALVVRAREAEFASLNADDVELLKRLLAEHRQR